MGWDNAMRTGRGRMRVMASSLNTELGQARPRPPRRARFAGSV